MALRKFVDGLVEGVKFLVVYPWGEDELDGEDHSVILSVGGLKAAPKTVSPFVLQCSTLWITPLEFESSSRMLLR